MRHRVIALSSCLAVASGLGTMISSRRRISVLGLKEWADGPLPKPPPLHSAVYVREGGSREIYEQLADQVAAVIHGPYDRQARDFGPPAGLRNASSAA